jgi:hypothetical protein
VLEPRSAYVLRGPVRSEWEHSVPGASACGIESPSAISSRVRAERSAEHKFSGRGRMFRLGYEEFYLISDRQRPCA